MDSTDFKILKILQEKARIPNVEVSRAIGMAPSAVLERIKKLEAQGIIDGYEVRLNPGRFHRSMIAFIHIQISPPSMSRETGAILAGLDEVQEVHFLAGDDCFLVKLRVKDTTELEAIIRNRIAAIKAVTSTKTFVCLSTYKETARIPLSDIAVSDM
ncbi:MAG: Lrp/AsnC family transcriptional regulator [Pseudomonadota bacterium]